MMLPAAIEPKELVIRNEGAPDILADLYSHPVPVPMPLVIISHGFLGYRRWGFFPWLSARLAESGFNVLTFSFSHCGVDEEDGGITDPALFASNSVSREISDLLTVCQFARSSEMPARVGGQAWALLGHSRGGAASILAAPDVPETAAVVSWSGLSKLDRYTARRKEEWKRTGRLPFNESRAESGLWLDYSYYEDIEQNLEKYDLPKRAAEMGIPHLIVHGRHDRAVTMKEAERLLKYPRESEVKMEIIEGCGHAFGAVHPMKEAPPSLQEASIKTALWLREKLLTLDSPAQDSPSGDGPEQNSPSGDGPEQDGPPQPDSTG